VWAWRKSSGTCFMPGNMRAMFRMDITNIE
jgi:hypothetical protein